METLAQLSLVVIGLVYAGLAIAGLVGIIVLIKLYSDMKKKLDDVVKQVEPYQSKLDDMLYKTQQLLAVAEGLAEDVKELSSKAKDTGIEVMDKAKETSFEIMDKTKGTVVEVTSLVVDTKTRVENHTNYIFNRVKTIEEKLDNIYAFLTGISNFVSKLVK
ncbi:DUF948 domain-containing protein [Hippea jasoniae]|uniref:DUF948 domain-containing protein n=1 Tax=Hippea jasoniae TaxID=944479 RepID=UPI000555082D|nr:DUF948 domain-containing protein [Hippea jasoniae]